ncbi:MAG: CPBP family intramembrane metalloprotease [Clostridia bacterium]|nr:CPBP family intramembrane metalloprotease [Clostridia bacterium]
MEQQRNETRTLLRSVVLLVILQAVREGIGRLVLPYLPPDLFWNRMLTMWVMTILTVPVLLIAQNEDLLFRFFPKRFTRGYAVATAVTALLYITAPANFTGGFRAVALLLYGSIVTPAFEELLFRSLLWERCTRAGMPERRVFGWNVALFTLWHLGYMLPAVAAGNWAAVLTKLAAGFGYGVVLGLVRRKTGSVYACFLVHGVLNLFMI